MYSMRVRNTGPFLDLVFPAIPAIHAACQWVHASGTRLWPAEQQALCVCVCVCVCVLGWVCEILGWCGVEGGSHGGGNVDGDGNDSEQE